MDQDTFLASHYNQLYKYALSRCWYDRDRAADLLQHVILLVCEGKEHIDWDSNPLHILYLIMLREVTKFEGSEHLHQFNYEDEANVATIDYDARTEPTRLLWHNAPPSPSMLKVFDIIATLTPQRQELVYWMMQGGTLDGYAVSHKLTRQAIAQQYQTIIRQIRKRLK